MESGIDEEAVDFGLKFGLKAQNAQGEAVQSEVTDDEISAEVGACQESITGDLAVDGAVEPSRALPRQGQDLVRIHIDQIQLNLVPAVLGQKTIQP